MKSKSDFSVAMQWLASPYVSQSVIYRSKIFIKTYTTGYASNTSKQAIQVLCKCELAFEVILKTGNIMKHSSFSYGRII